MHLIFHRLKRLKKVEKYFQPQNTPLYLCMNTYIYIYIIWVERLKGGWVSKSITRKGTKSKKVEKKRPTFSTFQPYMYFFKIFSPSIVVKVFVEVENFFNLFSTFQLLRKKMNKKEQTNGS
jgi:hypothetical protein